MKPYWPRSGDRGSVSRLSTSRRTRSRNAARAGPALARTGQLTVKVWPSTDASWSSARSPASSASRRAGDERVQGLRDSHVAQVAERPEPTVASSSRPSRSSFRTVSTAYRGMPSARSRIARCPRGQARHEAGEELPHRWVGQRLEARATKLRRPAPTRAVLEELRPRQRHDVDGLPDGPLEQVVDEVQQPRVGPVQVLEDEDRRALLATRSKNVRHAAKSSSRPRAAASPIPSRLSRRGLDPAPLGLVGDVLRERRGDPLAGRGRVVALGQPGTAAHHLAQRPEGDALAVGRASGPGASTPSRRRHRCTSGTPTRGGSCRSRPGR